MADLPSLFISHGAPTLAVEPGATHDFLKQLGAQVGPPKAVLCISAHWATRQPMVSAAAQPATIHDFSGFPEALYRLQYAAPGAPKLAVAIAERLSAAGLVCELNPSRGLDHGAWNPLLLMYPAAEVPVLQLSVQPRLGPAHHLALGRALAPLRQEGVLILGSGSATHNLWEMISPQDALAVAWAKEFASWLTEAVTQGRVEDLVQYRQLAPHAARNHPTDEHLLPLFVALGAGAAAQGQLLHDSFTYGVLSMAAYAFA